MSRASLGADAPLILIDDAIFGAESLFASLRRGALASARIVLRPGAGLDVDDAEAAADLAVAQAIVVRTMSPIDAELLSRAPALRFVGSASAGYDHVDLDALAAAGIAFAHSPGCNARAVAEWVVAALVDAAIRSDAPPALARWARDADAPLRVGIVGCGAVGSQLRSYLEAMGVQLHLCDPLVAERGELPEHEPLETLLAASDVISFHTSLSRSGRWPSHGLISAPRLRALLADGKTIVNASRGEVLELPEARSLVADDPPGALILDVWPGEPRPPAAWIDPATRPSRLFRATPHIAGYSYEGKLRATTLVAGALAEHFEVPGVSALEARALALLPPPSARRGRTLEDEVQEVAAFGRDDADLRSVPREADGRLASAGYRQLRRGYAFRREWAAHQAQSPWSEASAFPALAARLRRAMEA